MKYILYLVIFMVSCSAENVEGEKSWINFQINENDFHDDLNVTIPSQGFTSSYDTYYFNLDNSIDKYEGYGRVKASLATLLQSWIINLNDLEIDSLAYLPIDFSDQYIAGFRCQLIYKDSLKLEYGFSSAGPRIVLFHNLRLQRGLARLAIASTFTELSLIRIFAILDMVA